MKNDTVITRSEISQKYKWYILTRYEADERGELSPQLKRGVFPRMLCLNCLRGKLHNPLAMYHFLSDE